MTLEELIKTLEGAKEQAGKEAFDWDESEEDGLPWLAIGKVWVIGPTGAEGLGPEDMEAVVTRHNTADEVLAALKQLDEALVTARVCREDAETNAARAEKAEAKVKELDAERDDLRKQISDLGHKAREFTPADVLRIRVQELELESKFEGLEADLATAQRLREAERLTVQDANAARIAFARERDKALSRVEALEARLESPGFERFMADDGDGERDTFETIAEAREFAEQAIVNWRGDANDGWSDCVEGVTVWVAIERARSVVVEKNYPDDADSVDFVLKPLPVVR